MHYAIICIQLKLSGMSIMWYLSFLSNVQATCKIIFIFNIQTWRISLHLYHIYPDAIVFSKLVIMYFRNQCITHNQSNNNFWAICLLARHCNCGLWCVSMTECTVWCIVKKFVTNKNYKLMYYSDYWLHI